MASSRGPLMLSNSWYRSSFSSLPLWYPLNRLHWCLNARNSSWLYPPQIHRRGARTSSWGLMCPLAIDLSVLNSSYSSYSTYTSYSLAMSPSVLNMSNSILWVST
jgi:hypothetical protein